MAKQMSSVKIQSIIALLAQKHSYSRICKLESVSKGFISKVVSTLAQQGISLEEAVQLDEKSLHDLMYPAKPNELAPMNFESIEQELKKPSVTMSMLYEHYKSSIETGRFYSYSSFCRLFKNWLGDKAYGKDPLTLHREPGDVLEIDYAGKKLYWIDPEGSRHCEKIFVACLPWSGLIYAEPFQNEKQESWVSGIVHSLEYFQGVPNLLSMDNARALVIRHTKDESVVQPVIQELCQHYQMEVLPTRVAQPRDKNRVEASVGVVERQISAFLMHEGFKAPNRQEMQRLFRDRLDEINARVIKGLGVSRRDLWTRERVFMKELPAYPFNQASWKVKTVEQSHCIRLHGNGLSHRYSVPKSYHIGSKIMVQVTEDKLRLYDEQTQEFICEHVRVKDALHGTTSVLKEHRSAAERSLIRNVEDWRAYFVEDQGMSAELFDALCNIPRMKGAVLYKRMYQWRSLIGDFSLQIVEQALRECLKDPSLFNSIRALCKLLSQQLKKQETPDYQTPEHQNIRGGQSYE